MEVGFLVSGWDRWMRMECK